MEGTAKYADINSGINATLSRKMKEKMIKKNPSLLFKDPIGTIPFLGTFLKDLEYISAQNSTKNDKGLINVMQKRKEYEIIAQIKLLQQASHLYSIKQDAAFPKWLHSLPVYNEVQNYEFSYMIEPKFDRDLSCNSSSSNNRKGKFGLSQGSRSESVESIASSNLLTNGTSKTPSSISKQIFKFNHSRNSSMGSSADIIDNQNMGKSMIDSPQSNNSDNQSTNTSNSIDGYSSMPKYAKSTGNVMAAAAASTASSPSSQTNTSGEIRVKVNIESSEINKNDSGVLYKKMYINDKLRTKDVKRLILQKFFLNPDLCDKYILVQILNSSNGGGGNESPTTTINPLNELIINDNCNVFYAAKTVIDMQFVLRPRSSPIKQSHSFDPFSNEPSSLSSSPYGTKKNAGFGTSSSAKLNRYSNYNSSYNQLPPHSPSKANGTNGGTTGSAGSSSHKWWIKKILS